MTPDRSCSFDRAADYYDRTRQLTPELMDQVLGFLGTRLARKHRILEIGTGTGRISLPLHEHGIPIFGSDLSDKMMARLIAKAGGAHPFPLVRADATELPFKDGSFDAVVACWVLHLIPDWKGAVSEVARVLLPDGAFLVNQGGWGPRGWWRELQERFAQAAGTDLEVVGVVDADILDHQMKTLGATVEIPEPFRSTSHEAPGRRIDEFEAGLFSWTWTMDDATRRRAAEETRKWAAGKFGSVDEPQEVEFTDTWRIYHLSAF